MHQRRCPSPRTRRSAKVAQLGAAASIEHRQPGVARSGSEAFLQTVAIHRLGAAVERRSSAVAAIVAEARRLWDVDGDVLADGFAVADRDSGRVRLDGVAVGGHAGNWPVIV